MIEMFHWLPNISRLCVDVDSHLPETFETVFVSSGVDIVKVNRYASIESGKFKIFAKSVIFFVVHLLLCLCDIICREPSEALY